MLKKIISVMSVLLTAVILFTSFSASAVKYECDKKTYSDSILMVNLDSGTVVYEKDPDSKRYPASLTKIMTYIIVAENVKDFEKTRVEIKKEILDELNNTDSSLSGLSYHIGDKMTVKDLLYCLMVSSGNDAALVLADYVGNGNVSSFVEMMNQKANALGCKQTHFMNPHGLHDDNHYTTARDMYLITSYAMTMPMFTEVTSTTTYYCEGDEYPIITTNHMIDANRGGDYYYMYATGVKTGTTNEAGRCLVSTAVYEGYSYMIVCMHSPYDETASDSPYYTMIESADLYRWAFTQLKFMPIVSKETPVYEQSINYAWDKDKFWIVPEKDINIIMPESAKDSDIKIVPDTTDTIDAPVKKGDFVCTGTVYYKDEEVAKVNLVASESIDKSQLLYIVGLIKSIVTSVWFLLAVIFIIVLLIVYIIISSVFNRKNKNKNKNKNVRRYRNL